MTDPIPMHLYCPFCHAQHFDPPSFRPHKTHACQNCGEHFQPALVETVGVKFLPGCQSMPTGDEAFELNRALGLRKEGAKHERARIVAWIRAQGDLTASADWYADAIEQGYASKAAPNHRPLEQVVRLTEVREILHAHQDETAVDAARRAAKDLDQLRVQLAGCLTAAEGAVKPTEVANEGDFGWSLAYQKVVELRRLYERVLRASSGRETRNGIVAFLRRRGFHEAATEVDRGADLEP